MNINFVGGLKDNPATVETGEAALQRLKVQAADAQRNVREAEAAAA